MPEYSVGETGACHSAYRLGAQGLHATRHHRCHSPLSTAAVRIQTHKGTTSPSPYTITPYPHPKKEVQEPLTPLSNFLTTVPNPHKNKKKQKKADTPSPARYANPHSGSPSSPVCPIPTQPCKHPKQSKAKQAYKHPPPPTPHHHLPPAADLCA